MLIRLAAVPAGLEQDAPLATGFEGALAAWEARPGDIVTVADPEDRFYRARLLNGAGLVRPFERLAAAVEPPAPRRLCPGIPDRERMIWTIQKGVELGATEIQPLWTRHSHGAGDDGPRQDKSGTWNRVARKAARQCRRGRIPPVLPPVGLDVLLTRLHREEILLYLDTLGDRTSLTGCLLARAGNGGPVPSLTLLSGPEGGWSDGERVRLREAGGVAVSLGERVLRAETAAVAAMAVIMAIDAGISGAVFPMAQPGKSHMEAHGVFQPNRGVHHGVE